MTPTYIDPTLFRQAALEKIAAASRSSDYLVQASFNDEMEKVAGLWTTLGKGIGKVIRGAEGAYRGAGNVARGAGEAVVTRARGIAGGARGAVEGAGQRLRAVGGDIRTGFQAGRQGRSVESLKLEQRLARGQEQATAGRLERQLAQAPGPSPRPPAATKSPPTPNNIAGTTFTPASTAPRAPYTQGYKGPTSAPVQQAATPAQPGWAQNTFGWGNKTGLPEGTPLADRAGTWWKGLNPVQQRNNILAGVGGAGALGFGAGGLLLGGGDKTTVVYK